jgi:hypothetical protein
MEECVRRNEKEGKEINPVTCNFVKKCKAGEIRNEQGRCIKGKSKSRTQNKPVAVPFAPFVYTRPLDVKKTQSFTRKNAMTIQRKKGNTYKYNIGRPGRVTKKASLYGLNNEGKRITKRETRNSLNLERAKRGIVFEGKTRKSANETPEALEQLEEELAEGNATNMRPLQVRKRRAKAEEAKRKKEEALAGKGISLNSLNSKRNRYMSQLGYNNSYRNRFMAQLGYNNRYTAQFGQPNTKL